MKKIITILVLVGVGLTVVGVWSYLHNSTSFFEKTSDYINNYEIGKDNKTPDHNEENSNTLGEIKFVYGQLNEDVVVDLLAHSLFFALAFEEKEAWERFDVLLRKYGVTEEELEAFVSNLNTDTELALRIRDKTILREEELRNQYINEIQNR